MFTWYCKATICYAFLHHVSVHDSESPFARDSAFYRSKWFARGWTLHDLKTFCSSPRNGRPSLRNAPHLFFYNESSWASGRQTTRVEDTYCLLGLFNINMPTIDGEGKEAFIHSHERLTHFWF